MPCTPPNPIFCTHHHTVLAHNNPDTLPLLHVHKAGPNQSTSMIVQSIRAPPSTVWALLRRFDCPQAYKTFISGCKLLSGDGHVGTVRQVSVMSGLPASTSIERLEILDEENHVIGFRILGGDHRLNNYRSVTSVHVADGKDRVVVVESYVVDVPEGNTREETRSFADTIVRCNLKSLARAAAKSDGCIN